MQCFTIQMRGETRVCWSLGLNWDDRSKRGSFELRALLAWMSSLCACARHESTTRSSLGDVIRHGRSVKCIDLFFIEELSNLVNAGCFWPKDDEGKQQPPVMISFKSFDDCLVTAIKQSTLWIHEPCEYKSFFSVYKMNSLPMTSIWLICYTFWRCIRTVSEFQINPKQLEANTQGNKALVMFIFNTTFQKTSTDKQHFNATKSILRMIH